MQLCRHLLFSLALLQGLFQASAYNYTTYRIELDPDVNSLNLTCIDSITALIIPQVAGWYVGAVANQTGSYPTIKNMSAVLKPTMIRGKSADSTTVSTSTSASTVPSSRQLTCSTTTCYNCCSGSCTTLCGACRLCRRRRNLRDGKERMLDATSDTWWYGDTQAQSNAATFIKFAAQVWLKLNDPNMCMGNPRLLNVLVNYF
jgi:hypothetical protein